MPPQGNVHLTLNNDGQTLEVTVRDNGKGLPDGFSIERSDSLGLSIVSRLVESQLSGTISMSNDNGTVVRLIVPISAPETDEPA